MAHDLIRACTDAGLQAIAITDHHEGVYVYEVIETIRTLDPCPDLWVFPGMELTLKDSCQALIIFDADLQQSIFEKARNRLGLPADVKPTARKGIEVELLDINIEDLQDALAKDAELANRFIILPHVKPGGHKTVLRTGFHKRFRDMPYVGGYMDRIYTSELNPGDRRILAGEIPAWTSDRRGVISTSDSRFADFRLIGKHASWIKLAAPTAESIRQAMLAADSRLADDEPKLPKIIIEEMEIIDSSYLGSGKFTFNPQLNSIIGGRGAGKSSLLEYIRFGLGCSALDQPILTDQASARMSEMLRSTLSGNNSGVKVSLKMNGVKVNLSRRMSTKDVIELTSANTRRETSPSEINAAIPVQSFRQGELSELAGDQAVERLIELVTADESEHIRKIESQLRDLGGRISETLQRACRLTLARSRQRAVETEIGLVRQQLSSLESQIAAPESESRNVIAAHNQYQEETARVSAFYRASEQAVAEIGASLDRFKFTIEAFASREIKLDDAPLRNFHTFVSSLVTRGADQSEPLLVEISDQINLELKNLLQQLCVAREGWDESAIRHHARYEDETKKLSGQKMKVDELERLSSRAQELNRVTEEVAREQATLSDSEAQLLELRSKHRLLQEDLDQVVARQTAKIQRASGGLARGQVGAMKRTDELVSALNTVLDLPHMRESRIEGLVKRVGDAPDAREIWSVVVDELMALLLWKSGNSSEGMPSPRVPLLLESLDATFLERLLSRLEVEHVALAMRVIFRPSVEIFQVRGQSEVEFKKASQGEQAAALLNILMSQAAGPLVIDQPEADLDNRIINEIIRTIRSTKEERQLILATHSANITVNGDSELVTELQMGKQGAVGAIDESTVRGAITDTMEGGKDAFELRRRKYNF